MHPGLRMQLDSEIELPFTGATVGDDSTLQYTLNFPGCNLSPPHCPLSPDIASLKVNALQQLFEEARMHLCEYSMDLS